MDAGKAPFELGQLMVMRREKRFRTEALGIRHMLDHGPGDSQPVKGTGPAADLIEDDKAFFRRIAQDIRDLGHFHHKGTLAGGKVIRGADAGEDPVAEADIRALRRYK